MAERLGSHDEKPPKWWHDAIRNNFPGSLVDDNKFVTFPTQAEGFLYTIISQTKDDPGSYPEGIFIDTTIPAQKANEVGPILVKIMTPILETFRKEGEAHTGLITPADPRLAELGMQIRTGSSLNVGVNIANGFVVLTIEPSTPEETMQLDTNEGFENFKKEIIDNYFTRMDLIERAKLLSLTEIPVALKKEILKREFEDMDLALSGAYAQNLIERKKIEELVNDPDMRRRFERLVQKMTVFQTPLEKSGLETVLSLMDNSTIAAFYNFYRNYWQEKLGPIV